MIEVLILKFVWNFSFTKAAHSSTLQFGTAGTALHSIVIAKALNKLDQVQKVILDPFTLLKRAKLTSFAICA